MATANVAIVVSGSIILMLPASKQAPANSQANINGNASRAERPLSRNRFMASASQGQIASKNTAAIRTVISLQ
jgi:hypothetical protein